MKKSEVEVLGLGGPFVDYVLEVDEGFLKSVPGGKGGMTPVDYPLLQRILDSAPGPITKRPGGSTANTIRGLAELGHGCAMTGKIGQDSAGLFFLQSLEQLGIQAHFAQSNTPTAQVACLVTPDGERTMRSFLGAACEMQEEDLNEQLFEGPRLVHIEGYGLYNGQVTQQALRLARRHEVKTSFSLASFEVVEHFRDVLPELLEMHVDIVFANEDEGHALHGLSPRYCCLELAKLCEIAVVSVGAQGCYVAHNGMVVHCEADRVKVVDCIGAGDLFASGFLHGYLEGKNPETCGQLGCAAGSTVVQVAGAGIPSTLWPSLRERFGNIKRLTSKPTPLT